MVGLLLLVAWEYDHPVEFRRAEHLPKEQISGKGWKWDAGGMKMECFISLEQTANTLE